LNETMTRRGGHYDRAFRQRSGWLIPLAIFVVTIGLSAFFLIFYLAPAPTSLIEERPSPTSRTELVRFVVGGLAFAVPANYLLYANARQGGGLQTVELYAKYPGFEGYSDEQAKTFAGSGAESPIVHIVIREDRFNLDEAERLRRIYLGYVVQGAQKPGPYGLTQYAFRDDSGYRDEDLFVGNVKDGPAVMRCMRLSEQDTHPNCLRDERLARGVVMSYRFKRAYLSDWQQIARGVNNLTRSFIARAK
jgi:hypothetical protein